MESGRELQKKDVEMRNEVSKLKLYLHDVEETVFAF